MRRFHLIALLAAVTFSAGCELIEETFKGDTADTAVPEDDTADTADTAEEPAPEGAAFVRFISVADGQELSFDGVNNDYTPDTVDVDPLFFTQGTDYVEVSPGEWGFTMSDAAGESTSATVTVADGGHYTLAALRDVDAPNGLAVISVLEDDLSDVTEDHSRVRWIHARPADLTYAGQVYYHWGSAESEWYNQGGDSGTLFIDAGESESWEYPYEATSIYIFGQWGVPTNEAQVALEADAFIQAGNGELVNVFLTCEGACAPEDAFILGQFEDGTTATTAGCTLYNDDGTTAEC